MTRLRAGAATDVGLVRSVNQDCWLVGDGLYAVADGMGGHAAGDVAARLAVQTMRDRWGPRGGAESPALLIEAIQDANRVVFERSRKEPDLRGMGTTMTAVALGDSGGSERLLVANVGDSRVYLMQGGQLTQLTADHSLVEEMVRSGELSQEQAVGHPHRHILTRALGIEADIEVDFTELAPHVGDRLLLCSDGLVNEVSDDEIAKILGSEPDPDAAAAHLVQAAKANGGADNITVVIVDVEATANAGGAAANGGALSKVAPGTATSPSIMSLPASATSAYGGPSALGGSQPTRQSGFGRAVTGQPGGGVDLAALGALGNARGPAHARRSRHTRRITGRAVLFMLALIAVVLGAFGSLYWYARSSWYVGLSANHLTVYRGRPGGLALWKPTVADRTSVAAGQVLPAHLADLRAGQLEPSRAAAERYVRNLVAEYRVAHPTATTATPTTSTAPSTTPSTVPSTTATSAP